MARKHKPHEIIGALRDLKIGLVQDGRCTDPVGA